MCNLQGDVVGIHDAAGNVVATYDYDAWGNQLTTQTQGSIGELNPIRYRGYYYDTETKLYYLQSRYYNSEWGRFISADVYADTGTGILGTNMYAYCQNDPVNYGDPGGTDAIYVLCYGGDAQGLPVVGHSLLLLQDAKGVWWYTEFSGPINNPSAARIVTGIADASIWKRVNAPVKGVWSGASSALFKGDFTKSLELAKKYAKLDTDATRTVSSFGAYDVLMNNCLHYVQEIMTLGTSSQMQRVLYNIDPQMGILTRSNPIVSVPSLFYAELLAALRLSGVKKPK